MKNISIAVLKVVKITNKAFNFKLLFFGLAVKKLLKLSKITEDTTIIIINK